MQKINVESKHSNSPLLTTVQMLPVDNIKLHLISSLIRTLSNITMTTMTPIHYVIEFCFEKN